MRAEHLRLWTDCLQHFDNLQGVDLLLLECMKPNKGLLSGVVGRTYCEPDAEFRPRRDSLVWYDHFDYLGFFVDPIRMLRLKDREARSQALVTRLESVNWEGFDMRLLGSLYRGFPSIFEGVCDLRLTIYNQELFERRPSSILDLQQLMARASRLERVYLGASHDRSFDFRWFCNLDDVWPNVRHIELCKSTWLPEEIDFAKSFVERHRPKLESFVTSPPYVSASLNPRRAV